MLSTNIENNETIEKTEDDPYSHIPEEFRPGRSRGAASEDEDGSSAMMMHMFADDENDAQQGMLEEVSIGSKIFKLLKPQGDVGSLFADQVWSGSILMAEFLVEQTMAKEQWVTMKQKSTIEMGAGTGLPSLVALSLGTSKSVITDYPEPHIVQALQETVGYNWETCGLNNTNSSRVHVMGHEWGSCTKSLKQCLKNDATFFDIALVSECIWNHKSHTVLIQSLDEVLDPDHGIAIVTNAHHIPGLEDQDDAFFDECAKTAGLETIFCTSQQCPYMWSKDKSIEVFLRVLQRRQRK